jgi:hypothetical protein
MSARVPREAISLFFAMQMTWQRPVGYGQWLPVPVQRTSLAGD